MLIVSAPFPQEFREDADRVALTGDTDVTLAQIVKDFDIHLGTLNKWLRNARTEAGEQPTAGTGT